MCPDKSVDRFLHMVAQKMLFGMKKCLSDFITAFSSVVTFSPQNTRKLIQNRIELPGCAMHRSNSLRCQYIANTLTFSHH